MDSSEANQLRKAFGKIVACIRHGKLTEAEALSRQLLRNYPDDPNILRVLGVTLMRQDRFEEASKQLSTAVEVAPEMQKALNIASAEFPRKFRW